MVLAIVGLALSCGCASTGSDLHLAPVYSRISTVRGGVFTEALGGSVIARRPSPESSTDLLGLRPLVVQERMNKQASDTYFLHPLGFVSKRPGRTLWYLLPLIRHQRAENTDGTSQSSWFVLPGIYISRYPDGRVVRAWFPFAGVLEGVLSFDRVDFVLWPLFTRVQRGENKNYYVLWPFFAWSDGPDAKTWRVWPIVGRNARDGLYDRWFFLWPIFQRHDDNLKASPEFHSHKWFVFPLIGRAEQGSFRSTSILWPFFGYSSNPETGFWALDAPWFLIRIQRPGDTDLARRTRFWPVYSSFEEADIVSKYYLWPIANRRVETYHDGRREALHIIPFWQSYRRTYDSGHEFEYEKFWPFYRRESSGSRRQIAFPSLNFFWRTPRFDHMYAWMWELFAEKRDDGTVRQRSWLGLWRRERDRDEDRRYFAGLWSQRRYTLGGEAVRETALLFGLLRWRSDRDGWVGLLPPALPGPGWPLERMPSTVVLDETPAVRPQQTFGEEWIDAP